MRARPPPAARPPPPSAPRSRCRGLTPAAARGKGAARPRRGGARARAAGARRGTDAWGRARADPDFTVSGARDHYRQQAQSSGVVLERVSEFGNFFSELPNFPAQSLRLRASDKVPAHVPRGYRPLATTRSEVAWKLSSDRVSGNNRYRFFRRPVMPARGEEGAEEAAHAAGGGGQRGHRAAGRGGPRG